MRRFVRKRIERGAGLLLAAALALSLGGCAQPEAADPHAGMVEVYDGAATAWITPAADVPVSALAQTDFVADESGLVRYGGETYRAVQGVDVSYYQGEIDWSAVAADGIEFAFIRAGYRGYSEGTVVTDERFLENAQGARAAGLQIGLYFFSQAVTAEEAAAEAAWLVEAAQGLNVTLPLVFDWEPIAAETVAETDAVRTDGMTGAETTVCARAFCDAVAAAGYTPGIYFSRWQGYYDYDLAQLTDTVFWVSGTGDWDDFYYAHSFWQYSFTGTVDGISAAVDRDIWFQPA